MLSVRQWRAHTALTCALAGITAGVMLLYKFPPGTVGFYPSCPLHACTGLLCPGCGATRALAALVHGNLVQALVLNPLVILLLPIVLLYCAEAYRRAAFIKTGEPPWPAIPRAVVPTVLAVAAFFTVVKNLP